MADLKQCTMAAGLAIMQGTLAIIALEELLSRIDDSDTADTLNRVAEALAANNHAMGLLLARVDAIERRFWWWPL